MKIRIPGATRAAAPGARRILSKRWCTIAGSRYRPCRVSDAPQGQPALALALPLIVKSLSEDGSFGISQASIVDTDEKARRARRFVHDRLGTAAIAEQYIEGRELYVGVLGNNRLRVLTRVGIEIRSLGGQGHADRHRKGKHDPDYQERVGIVTAGQRLAPEVCAAFSEQRNAYTEHWGSMDMRVSTFASLPRHSIFH